MVRNIHERVVAGTPDEVWDVLIDFGALYPASSGTFALPDGVFPGAPVRHDRVAYRVGEVEPGRRLWFDVGRAMPRGHGVELFAVERGTLVRHSIDSPLRGLFALLWPITLRRQHDRAIEGLLDNLERAMARKAARTP
ncbi:MULTISPECIES: SRPBCC family protein [Microbacterium]|uniref:SRPBCC family protein n=1 Tax=Microbacterium TaxID=33882 RepID=UPI00217CD46B|nr:MULTISPECIES: SRPBCC family protein [Microbacterium]UWF77290.1 SRPBCC family protein [Microbacterium neungamense]WCM55447.1 SRPBCC family protein [Microbacterium sp. EF45047]